MDATLGENAYKIEKIEKLHKLGYLPIEIVALPEGTIVPMHVPMFGITNTHKDFAWLPQSLESLISAESWHPMIAATVGYTYRQIVNYYYDLTCDDETSRAKALGALISEAKNAQTQQLKLVQDGAYHFLIPPQYRQFLIWKRTINAIVQKSRLHLEALAQNIQ